MQYRCLSPGVDNGRPMALPASVPFPRRLCCTWEETRVRSPVDLGLIPVQLSAQPKQKLLFGRQDDAETRQGPMQYIILEYFPHPSASGTLYLPL